MASKVTRKQYVMPDGTYIGINGSFMTGVKLDISGQKTVTLCENKWYEWILIFLPLLNLIVGVMGGAIGGGLAGFFGFLGAVCNAMILRTKLNIILKVVCCFAVLGLAFAVWFGIYLLIVGGISAAFPGVLS